MLCNDLLFSTNLNTILSCEVDVPIFDKCHHNIIFGKVNICVSRPPVYIRDVITVKQMWKIVSMHNVILIEVKLLKMFL